MKLNNKAFTLIEALATVLISTAVLAGIYMTFIVGNRAWIHYNNDIAIKQEARKAMYAMTSELREAKNVLIEKEPEGIRINFFRKSYGMVSYVWKKEGEHAQRIVRLNNDEERILANNISKLSLDYLTNMIYINITVRTNPIVGDPSDYHLNEKVALRLKTGLFDPMRKNDDHS